MRALLHHLGVHGSHKAQRACALHCCLSLEAQSACILQRQPGPSHAVPGQRESTYVVPCSAQALTGCIIWRCWNKTPRLDSLRTVWMAAKCAMMSIMEHVSRDTHSTPIISPLLSDLFFLPLPDTHGGCVSVSMKPADPEIQGDAIPCGRFSCFVPSVPWLWPDRHSAEMIVFCTLPSCITTIPLAPETTTDAADVTGNMRI